MPQLIDSMWSDNQKAPVANGDPGKCINNLLGKIIKHVEGGYNCAFGQRQKQEVLDNYSILKLNQNQILYLHQKKFVNRKLESYYKSYKSRLTGLIRQANDSEGILQIRNNPRKLQHEIHSNNIIKNLKIFRQY